MYVLFIVLNEIQHLSEILVSLKDMGIRGATVINTVGSRSVQEQPEAVKSFLFRMVESLQGDTKNNRTIFSVIETDEQIHDAMNAIEKILGGDMTAPDKGIMFVLPVTHCRGGELQRYINDRNNPPRVEE